VQDLIKDAQSEILLPELTKTENGYKFDSSNEMCRKLFLKKDEDDPIMKLNDSFGIVQKKVTREEKMEEEF
jgi:hypothetical protein